MSEKTILVIDDSATIRRLVDSELGNAGYRVIMAPTAEEGVTMANSERPDLIILDHQLPGTTGYEVCCQLLEIPEVREIPVVASSTLRKKAYAEYTDCSNVIDMLPKPYTGDLLRMTVANALETAAMVVQSQSHGTAVPEVIETQGESALQGSFSGFSLRELIDFLNNGEKCGRLEIELPRSRVSIFVGDGRIQGVTATGISADQITDSLPGVIADLAPMMNFTLRGRNCSEVDGIVDLLDNKVLDARLLRQLLRFQSAMLLQHCQTNPIESFRFDQGEQPPSLFSKLPLDLSLIALFVEASLVGSDPELTPESSNCVYVREPQRGQNLDRAGLSASQMKLLSMLSSPASAAELVAKLGLQEMEVQKILRGFVNTELVSQQNNHQRKTVIAISRSAARSKQMSAFFRVNSSEFTGRCVRDWLAVKLLLRRTNPDVLLFDLDDEKTVGVMRQMMGENIPQLESAQWIGAASDTQTLATSSDAGIQMTSWPEHMHELGSIFESTHQAEVIQA